MWLTRVPATRRQTRVAPFLNDSRLRYLRTPTQGKCHALNIGIAAARNEIVVITDDDCEVLPDWSLAHVQAFHDNPRVAVTFGNVLALDYDTKAGFTPVYLRTNDFLCRNVWQKLYARGIGANMALSRKAWREIGGFDPELGPGGRFPACEDGDFAVRCLLAGHYVFETSHSTVTHFGFRTWDQGRQLTRDAFYGIGAAYIKPLKCGHLSVLPLLAYEFVRYALYPSLAATLGWRPGKPTNWQRVHFFMRGILRGLRVPVNRTNMTYLPRTNAAIEDEV